jgi:hypothetical protein
MRERLARVPEFTSRRVLEIGTVERKRCPDFARRMRMGALKSCFSAALALLSFAEGAANQLSFQKLECRNTKILALGGFCDEHYNCSRVKLYN